MNYQNKSKSELINRIKELEKKTANNLLMINKKKYKSLLKNTPTPMYVYEKVGKDFILRDCNYEAFKMSTIKVKSLIGKSTKQVLKNRPDIQKDILKCYNMKKSFRKELQYKMTFTEEMKHLIFRYSYSGPNNVLISLCDITEQKKNELDLNNMNKKLSSLLEASHYILEQKDFKSTARNIFNATKKLTGATAGYVALLSENGKENEVVFLDAGGRKCTVDPLLPMPIRGLRAISYKGKKTVYNNNFSNSKWWKNIPKGHVVLKNVMFAPLVINNTTVGIMGLANKPTDFTEQDKDIAASFGEYCAIALKNSRYEDELLLKSNQLQKILRLAPVAIVLTDSKTNNINFYNDKFIKIFGYTIDKLSIADKWWKTCYPIKKYREEVRNSWEIAIEKARRLNKAIEPQILDFTDFWGEIHTVEFTLVPLEKQNIITMIDLTDQRKMAVTLQESEKKTRAYLEHSPNCTKMVDLDFNLQYMSSTGFKLLKLKENSSVYGKSYPFYFFPESFKKCMRRNMEKVKKTGEIISSIGQITNINGDELWLQSTLAPVNDEKGQIDYMVIVSMDITKQKKLQQQLIQSEKMGAVGQLSAGIAHEFNNLMTIIKSNSQLALMYNEDSKKNNSLRTIDKTVNRSKELIMDLQTFSKPKEPKKKIKDITEVIRETYLLQKKQLLLENINVVKRYNKHSNTSFDWGQMEQVFGNLFLNARHAMQAMKKGTITISIKDINESIQIRFGDTGYGISDKNKAKIFEPFFTTKGAYAKDGQKIKGTGLGLSVTYNIIKQHKGTIEVESKEGKGTTFVIDLPIAKSKKKDIKKSKNKVIEKVIAIHKDLKVLMVDDEVEIISTLKDILQQAGHKDIRIKNNGKQALALMKTYKPDIIFLDMMMPDMNGEDILKEIKLMKIKAPVVFISGKIGVNQNALKKMGAFGFIEKPFDIEDIFAILNKVERKRTR